MRLGLPMRRRPLAIVMTLALLALAARAAAAGLAARQHAGPQGDGTSYTPVGWHVTPVGRQVELGERPYGVALSPDARWLLVSNDGVADQSVMLIDTASGAVTQTIHYPAPKAVFLGVAWSPGGDHAYVSAGANDQIRVYDVAGGHLSESARSSSRPATALAASCIRSWPGWPSPPTPRPCMWPTTWPTPCPSSTWPAAPRRSSRSAPGPVRSPPTALTRPEVAPASCHTQ